jgi:Asp-tRNA(Asn)/Glu-tRNA(Gln) amidotransferase A subunit family amidase
MATDGYRRKPLKAPRASGRRLGWLAGLAEHRWTGAALAGPLLESAGVPELRAARCLEAPALAPPRPPREPPEPFAPPALEALGQPTRPEGFSPPSVADYASAYRQGRVDPCLVAERLLEACARAQAADPPLGAFIAQRAEDVRAQAAASAERFRRGRPLGPLDGVPVAVKDELDQRGYPTTVGTGFQGGAPAAEDAEAVARLRVAGALLVGKANMHEIGLGVSGLNPHHGPARNPFDPTRITGGSSSGPAAAVASGLCPLSVGADGGGSIRIPAALCGAVGLKPSFGRVSERGAAPLCWSVAHVGPIASSARDAALGYALMAGRDPADPGSWEQPAVTLEGFGQTDLSGVRLGVYAPWFEDAEPEVVAACRAALAALERAGAIRVPIELPELDLLRVVHMVTIVSEMAASQLEHRAAHRKDYGGDVRLNLALAGRLTAADYVHAQRLRVRLCGHFHAALRGVDAIVTPTTASAALPIRGPAARTGESDLEALECIMRFAPAANLTGLPAISVPAGFTPGGLPVGLQLIGRMWEEHRLLAWAAVVESQVSRRKPAVWFDLLAG